MPRNSPGRKSSCDAEHSTMQPSGRRRASNARTASGRDSASGTAHTRQPRISAKRRMPASFISWMRSPVHMSR